MLARDYQIRAHKHTIYSDQDYIYLVLGLLSKANNIAALYERLFRDNQDDFPNEELIVPDLVKELGNVLWYVAEIATMHYLDLNEIMKYNLKELEKQSMHKVRNNANG